MKLSDNALTTLETLKDYLGIPLSDTSNDRVLVLLINGASEWVETYSKRRFKKGTYTETYNGPSSDRLYLKGSPIVSISSINTGSVLSPSGYTLYDGEGGYILYNNGYWPIGNKNVSVEYVGGYVLPQDDTTATPRTLPYKVELATCMLAGGAFNKKDNNGTTSSSSGGMSVSFDKIVGDDIKAMLKDYRYYNV